MQEKVAVSILFSLVLAGCGGGAAPSPATSLQASQLLPSAIGEAGAASSGTVSSSSGGGPVTSQSVIPSVASPIVVAELTVDPVVPPPIAPPPATASSTGNSSPLLRTPASACAPGAHEEPTSALAFWGDSLTNRVWRAVGESMPSRLIFNGGVEAEPSTQVASRMLADTAHRPSVNVLWYGTANRLLPDAEVRMTREQVLADVAISVECLRRSAARFVVLSTMTDSSDVRGSEGHTMITALNADLQHLYPDNFVDVRALLIASADRNSWQDQLDVERDVVPTSFRSDTIHLNAAGNSLIAEQLRQFFTRRGW